MKKLLFLYNAHSGREKIKSKFNQYKIKDYNLPVIPEKFYVELKEAYDAYQKLKKIELIIKIKIL